jgi:hypothetical protein
MTSAQSLLVTPLYQKNFAYAQVISGTNNNTTSTTNLTSAVHPDIDSSPIAAVIIIGKDMQGNVAFTPNNVTINQAGKYLL